MEAPTQAIRTLSFGVHNSSNLVEIGKFTRLTLERCIRPLDSADPCPALCIASRLLVHFPLSQGLEVDGGDASLFHWLFHSAPSPSLPHPVCHGENVCLSAGCEITVSNTHLLEFFGSNRSISHLGIQHSPPVPKSSRHERVVWIKNILPYLDGPFVEASCVGELVLEWEGCRNELS